MVEAGAGQHDDAVTGHGGVDACRVGQPIDACGRPAEDMHLRRVVVAGGEHDGVGVDADDGAHVDVVTGDRGVADEQLTQAASVGNSYDVVATPGRNTDEQLDPRRVGVIGD